MGQNPLKPIKMQDSLNYKRSQEKVEWSWKLRYDVVFLYVKSHQQKQQIYSGLAQKGGRYHVALDKGLLIAWRTLGIAVPEKEGWMG